MCAVVPILRHEVIQPGSYSERYLQTATAFLPEVLDAPSLQRIQSLLVLNRVYSALRLNVDPDELAQEAGEPMSWAEKETRRRCWFTCILTDFDVSFYAGRTSYVWNLQSSVRPYCDSEAWLALDAPGSSEPPRDAPLQWGLRLRSLLVRLLDSHHQANGAEVGGPALDFFAELDRLEAAMPPALRLRLDDDSVFAAVHDRCGGSRTAIDIFLKARSASVFAVSAAAAALMARLACDLPPLRRRGGEQSVRAALLAARSDAVCFWRAADAAVAMVALALLSRRANVALSGTPIGDLHYAMLGAIMLSALLHLLRLAPSFLAASVDMGLVSPRATPYFYCIPAQLHRTASPGDDDDLLPSPLHSSASSSTAPAQQPPALLPPFTLATIAALVRDTRAVIDESCLLWSVAGWMARVFKEIEASDPDSVCAAAGFLALRPIFSAPTAAATAASNPASLNPPHPSRMPPATAPPARSRDDNSNQQPDPPPLAAVDHKTVLPLNLTSLSGAANQRLFSAAVVLRALSVGVAAAVVPAAAPPDAEPAAVAAPVAIPSD
ncbi:hypothetical protein HK405_013257, partial [Cladochytrium tenue]